MKIETSVLKNGLTVLSIYDKTRHTSHIAINVSVGSSNELPDQVGMAHYLEHMLFKGTTNRTVNQLANEVEQRGSSFNAFTGKEQTMYYIDGLSEHWKENSDVVFDMIFNSTLPQEEMDKECHVVVQEIKRSQDNNQSIAVDALYKGLFPGQALGNKILGAEEDILSYTSKQLHKFYKANYHMKNMVFAVVSPHTHKEVKKLAKELSKSIKKRKLAVKSLPSMETATVRHHIDKLDANQAQIQVVWPHSIKWIESIKDTFALGLFCEIVGSGMSSRLFRRIREEMGLAYSVYSWTIDHYGNALLGFAIGTAPEQAATAIKESIREITEAASNVTQAELEKAKNSYKMSLSETLDNLVKLSHRKIGQLQEHGRLLDDDSEVLGVIDSITVEDVMRVANDILTSNPTIVTLSPYTVNVD